MKRPRPIGASASAQETISSYSHRYLSVVPVVITSFVLVMTVVIAVSIVIRMVIVLNTAVLSGPVARIITVAVVVWRNPASTLVRRSSPVAFVPFVMMSHWIPVAIHPHAYRVRSCGNNDSHTRRRWCPDHDANGNLCFAPFRRNQQHCDQQYRSDEVLHRCVS